MTAKQGYTGFLPRDRERLRTESVDDWARWLDMRLNMIVIRPMDTFFKQDAPLHDRVNSGERTFYLAGITIILCTIEALGGLSTNEEHNSKKFKKWLGSYMHRWSVSTAKGVCLADWLWDSARNGLAHQLGFKNGGVEGYATAPDTCREDEYGIHINPDAFYDDFKKGVQTFLADVRNPVKTELRKQFEQGFQRCFLLPRA